MGPKRGVIAGLAIVTAGVTGASTAIAGPLLDRGRTPTIKVLDNEYSKTRLAVMPGTEVTFKWDRGNSNPHNVTLRRGPNGINKKAFRSKTDETDVNFSPKFRKPGSYMLQCIIHPDDMNLDVVVREK